MGAIYKRELKSYFTSPVAYIFLGVVYIFSGIFLFSLNLVYAIVDIPMIIEQMFYIVIYILPLITMRMLSEDRKNKTDQALLTAPVSTIAIVLGKYFAALTVYFISCLIYIVYAVVFSLYSALMWGTVFTSFLGLFLAGAAIIAIGMFISGLTESLIVSALGSFGVSIFLSLVSSVAYLVNNEFVSKLADSISFYEKFSVFVQGQLDLSYILFFLSVIALFIYYSAHSIDQRRYVA